MAESINTTYPNNQAHNSLKSLMERRKRLEMFFNLDENKNQTVRIKTNDTPPFEYKINLDSFYWILNYLKDGDVDDKGLDCTKTLNADNETLDSIQKSNLKWMAENGWGRLEQRDNIKDKQGRYLLYLKFPHGLIHFFLKPDDDIINFLTKKGFVV